MGHKLSFPVTCRVSFSRCTILKIGVKIVHKPARLCMCVYVFTGAKRHSAVCTICACAESECKWLST